MFDFSKWMQCNPIQSNHTHLDTKYIYCLLWKCRKKEFTCEMRVVFIRPKRHVCWFALLWFCFRTYMNEEVAVLVNFRIITLTDKISVSTFAGSRCYSNVINKYFHIPHLLYHNWSTITWFDERTSLAHAYRI